MKEEGLIDNNIEYLITRPDMALDSDLVPLAIQDARDGKELFNLVPDSALQHPPHHATKTEIITLPFKIKESSLKDRWISGTRGDKDNIWVYIRDPVSELVRVTP